MTIDDDSSEPAQGHLTSVPYATAPHGAAPRRPRLRRGLQAAVLVTVVLAGGSVWTVGRDGGQDADAALAEAKAFVADTGSYRLQVTTHSRVTTGDPTGAGSEVSSRSIVTSEVSGPDRWTMTSEHADATVHETYTDQTIRVGDDLYVHVPPSVSDAAVAAPPWLRFSADEVEGTVDDLADSLAWLAEDEGLAADPSIEGLAVDLLLSAYLFDVRDDPTSLLRLVEEATAPVVEERLAGGVLRLGVHVEPVRAIADVVESALGEELAPVAVLLDVAADGRPVSVRFSGELGSASAEFVVDFRDWGSEIDVAAPAEDQIDQTPWVQEEALRWLDPALVIAPATPPASLPLAEVGVYEGTGRDWDCTSLDLFYDDPSVAQADGLWTGGDEDLPYLYLSVYPAACWLEDDADRFDRTLGGHPAREVSGFWEIQVGEAVVELDTSLDDAALEAFAASLAPTSADALISAVAPPPSSGDGR